MNGLLNADVVIVGAGAIGLSVAEEVAKTGVETTVVEEHRTIGIPSHCAGLISIRGARLLGIDRNVGIIENRIKGARFHSPGGLEFEVGGREERAYVINRVELDNFLADRALNAGARLILGSKALGLLREKGRISGIRTRNKGIRSRIVVDCEGAKPRLLKEVPLIASREGVPAVQFRICDGDFDPDYVEVFVGNKIAPGFFAYMIPQSPASAKVGLACNRGSPHELLKKFLKDRFKGCSVKDKEGGYVITGGPILKTYADGFLVVGDSAGQTKPTTGGGLVTGRICASIASSVIVEAIAQEDYSERALKGYQVLWKKKLGREFLAMKLARKLMNRFSDELYDKIFKTIIDNELYRLIEGKGDIDLQSKVILGLARKPSFMRILPVLLRNIVTMWFA